MIKPEQVPDEVADMLWQVICDKPGIEPKKAIAATLNAWPGMGLNEPFEKWHSHYISLPLPQEASDDQ